MKLCKTALAASIAVTLAACGGSDDGTDSTQQSTTYSVGGEVVDGYIYNALVWIDINQNGTLDDGEPNTYSNLDGSYDLELNSEQVDAIVGLPILAELTKDSVDVGSDPDAYSDVETLTQDLESGALARVFDETNTAHKITLSMPPLGSSDIESLKTNESVSGQVITPFTTRANESIAETLEALDTSDDTASLARIDELIQQAFDDVATQILEELGDSSGLNSDELAELLQQDFFDSENVPQSLANIQDDLGKIAERDVQTKVDQEVEIQKLIEDNAGATVKGGTSSKFFTPDNTNLPITVTEVWSSVESVEGTITTIENTSTTYFINDEGEKQEYSKYSGTYVEDSSNNSFYSYGTYQADLNFDGDFTFINHAYDIGTFSDSDSESSRTFERYLDEQILEQGDHIVAAYTGIELDYDTAEEFVTAIKAEDYSGIDSLQKLTETSKETSEYMYDSRHLTIYDHTQASPKDFATYIELREYWQNSDGSTEEVISSDWEADGSYNRIVSNASTLDGESYATTEEPVWNWDGSVSDEYQLNYWQASYVEKSTNADGYKETISSGEKAILNEDTAMPVTDDDDELMVFNDWLVTTVVYSDDDVRVHTMWNHYPLDGYEFTREESGQKYQTTVNSELVTFPEYWGQFIDDLPTVVDELVDEDLGKQAIWLRIIGESIRGTQHDYDYCDVEIFGDDATSAAFANALTQCGGTQAFTADDLTNSTIMRRKNGGTEVRYWTLNEGQAPLQETWTVDGIKTNSWDSWSITSDGHLVLKVGDYTRIIAAYSKGEYGAGVIVFDSGEGDESEIWSTYFAGKDDAYIPETPITE
ncbi:hypothetical protein ACPV5O_08950 [Vibrio maritimus]|uniref:hypothetical protein n=1 Tax=Vibrio maritimus TaxID=990268 RepID=UPI0040683AF5